MMVATTFLGMRFQIGSFFARPVLVGVVAAVAVGFSWTAGAGLVLGSEDMVAIVLCCGFRSWYRLIDWYNGKLMRR